MIFTSCFFLPWVAKSARSSFNSCTVPVTLTIQTTPNAPRSEIVGWLGDRLKVKVKAPAVEGKANTELVRFLAEHFGVRANAVILVRGDTARLKVVRIEGIEETALPPKG